MLKKYMIVVAVVFGLMAVSPASAAVIFADDMTYSDGVTPTGAADTGTWVAGGSCVVYSNFLRVFGPGQQEDLYGQATSTITTGEAAHFEFDVAAGTHDNTNSFYTPTWLLYGPATSNVIAAVRLNYQGDNATVPMTSSPIEAWDGDSWEDTGLTDPLDGYTFGTDEHLYEIDYVVGASSYTVTFDGGTPFTVNFDVTPTAAVVGVGYSEGTSSKTYSQTDNWVLTPEPFTLGVLALGGLGMLIRRRR